MKTEGSPTAGEPVNQVLEIVKNLLVTEKSEEKVIEKLSLAGVTKEEAIKWIHVVKTMEEIENSNVFTNKYRFLAFVNQLGLMLKNIPSYLFNNKTFFILVCVPPIIILNFLPSEETNKVQWYLLGGLIVSLMALGIIDERKEQIFKYFSLILLLVLVFSGSVLSGLLFFDAPWTELGEPLKVGSGIAMLLIAFIYLIAKLFIFIGPFWIAIFLALFSLIFLEQFKSELTYLKRKYNEKIATKIEQR